ncbi:WSC domain-containing protein [Lachnellula subtilissima]|uniref:WSC domain-containing protein n=1 Tax=Lachnellula subtilissima TaxID=602034 RepID=A0A8H8RIN8_9HELO|nr:WSC domain-containing protein [Lachnellula subtilissima]
MLSTMTSSMAKMKLSSSFSTTFVITSILSLVNQVHSLASTDTITWGGDNSRTGYQSNHNMDPSIVGSSQFGQLFVTQLPGTYNGAKEQLFAQPLVYTPSADGIQYVYLATTQNNIYKVNAKTGAIAAQRNLHIPFLAADLNGCVDITPCIGSTATGVIDPDTDTWYLTTKTYADQDGGTAAQGKPNGRYYVHAIDVRDLSERPNFPVNLEGTVARNNPVRSFNGGIHHQRPAILHTGQFIYAGFASHCVQYNFTGWIMGWDKTTGATVERYATEGAGVPNTTPGGGVWMSGGGLASDDAGSMFFASGNGYASQLSTIPVNGRNPPTSLEEAAVHMTINEDGSLTIVDFFMPWEKTQLDGADRDLGTSPLELLPSEFSCGDVKRIGVVTGKSGKTYWLNLDNLGGYQNGPNKLDDVIQVYQNENSVYAGAGVFPLEGGYIYINVIQYPSHVFKFSCDAGVPSFTKVADNPTKNAYILGVGHGTVTSLNGQTGTGLVWTSDVQGSTLRVYDAVPVNGLMTPINSFNFPNPLKFTRPVFGDGRAYMGTAAGALYAFGSPVNLPINCSSPYDFGVSDLKNATAVKTITCLANIDVTVTNASLSGDQNFVINGVPGLPLQVAAKSSFSFQATFDPQAVGPLSSDILVGTTNKVAGYSTTTPIGLRGTGQSVNPLLSVSPVTLAFQGVVTGAQAGGVNQSVIFTNLGNGNLSIRSILYSTQSETGPYIPANTTLSGPRAGPFTFIGLPSTIPGNSEVIVTVNFDTSASGNFAAYLVVQSNGGNKTFDVVGTSGSAPVALLEFQTTDGAGWVQYKSGTNFTFGNVTENTTRSLKMRLTNNATTDSARLSITVSKPPFGVVGIIGANNAVDLAEGTTLAPGENATATLYCSVPKEQWNENPYSGSAQWTMNVDDPNFRKQFIQFDCLGVSEQAPPLEPNGLGYYRYTGCFKENNPGRQLKTQLYANVNNTSPMCIAACSAAGYTFCGTQYNRECWGGPTIPIQAVNEGNCNYPCAGDINQICGGNGIGSGAGGSYISLFADARGFSGNVTTTPPSGPFVNPGVGGYTSIGCYTEGTSGRALSQQLTPTSKTVAKCVNACSAGNYKYAGMEYGGECWCGNFISNGASSTASTDCSMTCADNGTEYCGAGSRLNMYQRGNVTLTTTTSNGTTTGTTTPTPTGGPQIKQTIGNWAFQGCWTEITNARALAGLAYANDSMTLESCASFCTGFKWFGAEYGRECYCGNTLGTGSIKAANQADCSFLCPGNNLEYCGAGNRLELYSLAASTTSPAAFSNSSTTSTGNVLSSVLTTLDSTMTLKTSVTVSTPAGTILTTSTATSAKPTGPTIVPSVGLYNYAGCYTEGTNVRALAAASYPSDNQTVAYCASSCSSYTYFGVEYGRECWCGNSFGSGAVTTKDSDCSMLCAGDTTAYCGAGNRLNVYIKNRTLSTLKASTSSSSSLVSTPSSSGMLSLSNTQSASSSILPSTASSSAASSSSPFVKSTSSFLSSSPQLSTFSSSSSSSSTKNSSAISATPLLTVPVVSNGNANFTYYSCATEPVNDRLLSSKVLSNGTDMTIAMCLSTCYDYAYAGVENGRECWCGNTLNVAGSSESTPSANVSDSQCSFICPGNSTEYCGAENRLNLYWFDNVKAKNNAENAKT